MYTNLNKHFRSQLQPRLDKEYSPVKRLWHLRHPVLQVQVEFCRGAISIFGLQVGGTTSQATKSRSNLYHGQHVYRLSMSQSREDPTVTLCHDHWHQGILIYHTGWPLAKFWWQPTLKKSNTWPVAVAASPFHMSRVLPLVKTVKHLKLCAWLASFRVLRK